MAAEIKTDCKYFRVHLGEESCKVLKELVCRNKKCTFYAKSQSIEETEAKSIEKK